MKTAYLTIVLAVFVDLLPLMVESQVPSPVQEQELESVAAGSDEVSEDDTQLQDLEVYRKHQLNLNTASKEDLRELGLVSDLQLESLNDYKKLFGNLLSIFELQAVPLWSLSLIHRILPYVTVATPFSVKNDIFNRLCKGQHSLLLRTGRGLEKSKGFNSDSTGKAFEGDPFKIFIRYRYVYKSLLSFGIVADKDAGESFFRGSQKGGFDFYSAHLFAKRLGVIDLLALGDYTVNLGQGLIQWQSLAFKKSADITAVKRQSPVFRPYSSAGEHNFHRGIAIAASRKNVHFAAFYSNRNLSVSTDTDTLGSEIFTSFQASGNHRTVTELAAKGKLNQQVIGARLGFRARKYSLSLNAVGIKFSSPWQKRDEPYNYFSIKSDKWFNASVDYAFTLRNIHFFGEAALDMEMSRAILSGMLLTLDSRTDLSIVYRNIAPAYQSVNANSFTENSTPVNERGLYMGVGFRPGKGWKLDAYFDLYSFPFLKYQIDAPSSGQEYLLQAVYSLSRSIEIIFKFRNERKGSNAKDEDVTMNYISDVRRSSVRCQVQHKISRALTIRYRVEGSWFERENANWLRQQVGIAGATWFDTNNPDLNRETEKGSGSLFFADVTYKPMGQGWAAGMRMLYFGTDGYDSRLYAYENDVLFAYSIPAFFDRGARYYLNFNYDVTKKMTVWIKLASTVYRDGDSIGSGVDEIAGRMKTDVRLQMRYIF